MLVSLSLSGARKVKSWINVARTVRMKFSGHVRFDARILFRGSAECVSPTARLMQNVPFFILKRYLDMFYPISI